MMRHTSHTTAADAHSLCTSMLTTHPTVPFVPLLLESLTAIAQRFWSIHLEEQLTRLTEYVSRDSEAVQTRRSAAAGLLRLFSTHPNAVKPLHIHTLEQVTTGFNNAASTALAQYSALGGYYEWLIVVCRWLFRMTLSQRYR